MSILVKLEAYNREMQSIKTNMGIELRGEYAMAVDNPTAGGVAASLRTNTKKAYGIVDRIGAKFPRHGIFIEKGARKGYGGNSGSTWYDKNGARKQTNPKSFGKMNTGNSLAKPWLAPTLDKYTEIVANRAAAHFANIAQEIVLSSIPKTNLRK